MIKDVAGGHASHKSEQLVTGCLAGAPRNHWVLLAIHLRMSIQKIVENPATPKLPFLRGRCESCQNSALG